MEFLYAGELEQMKRKSEEAILMIKTDTEELDKNRRTLEEKNKKERANKIQNEVIQSHKKNVEIDWNWQELEEKEDCKELADVSFTFILNRNDSEIRMLTLTLVFARTLKLKKPPAPRSSLIS